MNTLDSFDGLYREYADAIFRFCLRAVSRREVAEEITSEVFLACHQSWSGLTPEQFPAWLFTVAKRRAADYWRRRYVEDRWNVETGSADHELAGLWREPEHSMADLLAGCTALKPIHRICLVLRFSQGMSRAEIAQTTNLTELQVKGHLQYALQLMRQHIEPAVTPGKGAQRDAQNAAGL